MVLFVSYFCGIFCLFQLEKVHLSQQTLEARIVAKVVKNRIHAEIGHVGIMLFVRFLQPFEGLVVLPGTGI